jgi:hypothetical protein
MSAQAIKQSRITKASLANVKKRKVIIIKAVDPNLFSKIHDLWVSISDYLAF